MTTDSENQTERVEFRLIYSRFFERSRRRFDGG